MKKIVFAALLGVIGLLVFVPKKSPQHHYPQPQDGTIVRTGQSEDEGNANRREQYFENMHRAAPGTNWKAIDRKNILAQYHTKRQLRQTKSANNQETFAEGELEGKWHERGSRNQAGSITALDYYLETDKIYAISAGGTLWKGSRSGNDWTSLNEDLQFDRQIVKVINNNDNTPRIITVLGGVIYYTDDEGQTMIPASNPQFNDALEAAPRHLEVLPNGNIYYLLQAWDNSVQATRIWLMRSTDNAASFERIYTFEHGFDRRVSMWSPHQSNDIYILDRSLRLFQVIENEVIMLNFNSDLPNNSNHQLKGHQSNDGLLTLYALVDNNAIYSSTDYGQNWSLNGTLPVDAWDIGIEVSPSNANILFAGAVEAYRSYDGGVNWTKVSDWWEYYDDVPNKLHADMMDFGTFYTTDNQEFLLIGNHGGINISYNNLASNTNISLENLNVSQYYDVVTSPINSRYMFAGTQDQGFQRSLSGNDTSIVDWQQQISGDYGHMIFSNSGQGLWIQYPGGEMSYYSAPHIGGAVAYWSMAGSDLPSYGWMLPSAETPDYDDNSIFIGGGNLNGSGGNHLIKLTYSNGGISAIQFDFDFRANSNNHYISAIEASLIDENRLYVATDDGTFFYSNDAGTSWTRTPFSNGPENWYLYGSTILASRVTPDLVYYAGSGYSNPPAFISRDGGQSFSAMSNGLPNTLVHELAANSDESLLFAATEIGPFVYSVAQDEWFDMRGLGAPMQRYTSVEYIDSEQVVRFGTYGRGAWDFAVSNAVVSTETATDAAHEMTIYPNPVQTVLTVDVTLPTAHSGQLSIVDAMGKIVQQQTLDKTALQKIDVDVRALTAGFYFVQVDIDGKVLTEKFIKK